MNHEILVICPHCHMEYDQRLHYYDCPFCKKNINTIENMDPKNKEKAEKIFSQIDTLNYYKQSWENATNVRIPMIELNSPDPNKHPNVPIDLTSFKILKENCLKEINTKLEELNKQLKDL